MQRLPKASWIAVDEEMTGIMLPPDGTTKRPSKPSKDESPETRYSSLKLVPERYAIIQLGIALFEQLEPQEPGAENTAFNVRRYKFTLFPPADSSITREVVLNPSSIHFLAQNNMNLDVWTREGIPFCTGNTASNLLEKFYEQQLLALSNKTKPRTSRYKKVELTRVEDKDFHARTMASLREWLDSAIVPGDGDTEGASFLLPPCNSFLRRALYESIPDEYPSLVLETYQDNRIRVWRLNAAEREQRNQRLLREGYEKLILEKIGVWRVFLALSKACRGEDPLTQAEHMILSPDAQQAITPIEQKKYQSGRTRRKIPLVVHNGLHDLLFLLTHFHSPTLPDQWAQCKELIHSYFPVIYDTKTMASQFCTRENPRSRTHLAAVYEQTITNQSFWDRTFVLDGREQMQEQLHDAAFDAYMTGAAFSGLSNVIHKQTKSHPLIRSSKFALWNCDDGDELTAWYYGRNKLYFHLSPYTIDLESPNSDPLGRGMSLQSTFRVAGIPPSVTTRDIVRCLTGLVDSKGEIVNFELIWVDDRTFLVGAMLHDCRDESKFQEHGEIMLKALRDSFKEEIIQPLEPPKESEVQPGRSLWNLWGWLGAVKLSNSESEQPNKKRRIE